jgi:hypothetical protein
MADDYSAARDSAYNSIGALTDTERKTAAYNALDKQYGNAIAYDPTVANNAAVANVTTQTAPDKIDASHRVNTADKSLVQEYGVQAGDPDAAASDLKTKGDKNEAQRMATYRGLQMLQASVDPTTQAVPKASYDKVMGTYGSVLGLSPEEIADIGDKVTAPGGAEHLDAYSKALIGPTPAVGAPVIVKNPDGTNSAIRFDKYGNQLGAQNLGAKTIAQERADTGVVNSGISGFRANTGRMAEQTGQYRAGVAENNSLFGARPGDSLPGDSRPSANFGGGNVLPKPSVDLIGAGNPKGTTTAPAAGPQVDPHSLFVGLPPKGRMQAVNQAQQLMNQGSQLQNMNTLLDQSMKMVNPYTAGTGSLMKELPGTAAADLRANLTTFKANGQMAWIASMKNSGGQTGVGRILQSEAKNAEALYGAMEQDQSAKQLLFHMQLFKTAVNNLYAHSRQGFQANYGVSPEGAMGEPERQAGGAAGGKFEIGKQYTSNGITKTYTAQGWQ